MKIAIVSKYFPPNIRGGGEISAYNLAQALAELGVEVHVITSANVEQLKESKFTLHPIIKDVSMPGILKYVSRNEIFYWNSYRAVSKFLADNYDIDVVHAMNMDSIPGAVLSAKRYRIPSVITISSQWLTCPTGYMLKSYNEVCNGECSFLNTVNCYMHSPTPNIYEKILGPLYAPIQMRERRIAVRSVGAVVCISQNVKSYVEKIFNNNKILYVIPNIVEADKYENKKVVEKLRSNILFVGALGKFKGCEYVIKAMPGILKEYPDCILRIIGDGERYEEFIELSKELGVHQNIIFEGFIQAEKMLDYYNSTDIVVFPSVVPETFGRVAAEAMAAGKPVIASNVGGIPEIVEHEETGILVEPKNPKQIADAVKYLLGNPDVAREMGKRGKELVKKRYSPSIIAKKYLEVYERLSLS